MGFLESDSTKCRRHPNHKQSPGVCSSCLREKLTKLSTSSFNMRNNTNISMVSYDDDDSSLSSASSSTTTGTRKSPGNQHRRNGSETYVSVGMVLNNGLKKSRSVSCAPLSRTKLGANDIINDKFKGCVKGIDEENKCNLKKKNNGGFLKKLIHTTSKKTKGVLMHSKTMKESPRSSSTSTRLQQQQQLK